MALACGAAQTAGKLPPSGWSEVVQRSRPGTTIPDAVVRGDTPAAGVSFVGYVMLTTAPA
jgi:hypothetical protein